MCRWLPARLRCLKAAWQFHRPVVVAAPMTRPWLSNSRRFRNISCARGTGSGLVQSPSMNDSPIPDVTGLSGPAGRTDRHKRSAGRPARPRARTHTCDPGTPRDQPTASDITETREQRPLRPPHDDVTPPSTNHAGQCPRLRLAFRSATPSPVRRHTMGTTFHHSFSACQ